MSNVLIGIIGVILFIGLALAGALILGDDFKSSKASTQAAKVVSDMQQIAAAYNMRQVKLGTTMSSDRYSTNVADLVPRFLKVAPTVPYSGGIYTTPDKDGFGTTKPIHHVQARIGATSDQTARSICREIEMQTGAADGDLAIKAVRTNTDWGPRIAAGKGIGCFQYDADGSYWAFLVL